MTIGQTELDALLSSAGELAATITEGDGAPSPAAPRPRPQPAARAVKSHPPPASLQRILKMRVPVIVTLAERNASLSSVLQWNSGSIIEFDTSAVSELRLMIANKVVGAGQPVKVGENFGLRITRIGDLADRIKALGPQ